MFSNNQGPLVDKTKKINKKTEWISERLISGVCFEKCVETESEITGKIVRYIEDLETGDDETCLVTEQSNVDDPYHR